MANINHLIDEVLAREGSEYTDRAADKGGPTKYGITQGTLSKYWNRPASIADVQDMTEALARAIYLELFWTRPGLYVIEDQDLADLVFDAGVQHGPARAIEWLQGAAGLPVDGVIGKQTHDLLDNLGVGTAKVRAYYRAVLAERISFYGEIISDNPREYVNAHGWCNRVASFVSRCP